MMNFTKNTGRQYAAEGQIIEVTVLSAEPDDVIDGGYVISARFNDKTRGIEGKVETFVFGGMTEKNVFDSVLSQYDAGRYNW